MRFTGFKTKAFFTLGIYVWVWHSQVVRWLRDEIGSPVTGQETWRLFIPGYNLVVWWRYFGWIRQAELLTMGVAEHARGAKPLSVGRAFWWSSLWFSAGPYTNRHLNAIDAFHRGAASQLASATPARFDEKTGQPLELAAATPDAPRFDQETGHPIGVTVGPGNGTP